MTPGDCLSTPTLTLQVVLAGGRMEKSALPLWVSSTEAPFRAFLPRFPRFPSLMALGPAPFPGAQSVPARVCVQPSLHEVVTPSLT